MIESTANIRVRFSETDAMGVVYHANYLPWFEVSRTQLMTEIGLPYRELQDAGFMLPVLEAHCNYKNSAKYDDELKIHAMMKTFPRVRIRIDYEVLRGDEILTTGYTVHAFMNRDGIAIRPPNFFLEKLAKAFGE
ncbi:MAG: acyl-CoA thioesterase [Opitutales bacterium]|nr:acyl-CoA thioesterase [Opitutales bacterium]